MVPCRYAKLTYNKRAPTFTVPLTKFALTVNAAALFSVPNVTLLFCALNVVLPAMVVVPASDTPPVLLNVIALSKVFTPPLNVSA